VRTFIRKTHKASEQTPADAFVDGIISTALKHVHIFRPHSLASTIATLDALPEYLFDKTRHYSFDRPVAFVALDSASAFYWQSKAEEENAAFLAATMSTDHKQPAPASYASLASALKYISSMLHCPIVLTSKHLNPVTQLGTPGPDSQTLRPCLPAPLSNLPTLRLISHRLPVRKFPAGISVEGARREAGDRQQAVKAARFACEVNEWNLDERTLRKLQQEGSGFGFRITGEGLIIETKAVEAVEGSN
ncbi:hypothetical protein LTR53_018166, partial [Teratosphaeriaceae sp. CCFEE 6253]